MKGAKDNSNDIANGLLNVSPSTLTTPSITMAASQSPEPSSPLTRCYSDEGLLECYHGAVERTQNAIRVSHSHITLLRPPNGRCGTHNIMEIDGYYTVRTDEAGMRHSSKFKYFGPKMHAML